MQHEELKQIREAVKQQLIDALTKLVRENGDDYNDYYRDEHGIEEGEGCKIVKVLDIASFGCAISLCNTWLLEDDGDPGYENDNFTHHAYWSLYIERDETGYETLMIYQFATTGIRWDDEGSEPEHCPADDMSLAELDYLCQAIYWHYERNND